jgi:hypothetical protein
MKQKPRWMKSVIEATKGDLPPLPFGRNRATRGERRAPSDKTRLAKA